MNEKLFPNELRPPSSGGDFTEIKTQLSEAQVRIEKKTSDYLYNLSAIKKFSGILNPKIVFWGDSITAGAGADAWYTNWINQFADTLQLTRGSMFGRGYVSVTDAGAGTPSGWTPETKGINQYRAYSSSATLTITAHQFADRTVEILFSKESDGGSFDVTIDGAAVASGDCAGATSFGNKLTITVPKSKSFIVVPKGKTYIEGFIYSKYGGVTDGVLVHKIGHGGFAAEQFSDAEINATIKTFTPDLTCIGHIVNDVNLQTPEVYRAKIEVAIQAGKASGDVLLYIPCRGKFEAEGTPRTYPFDQYKQILYDLANKYNCAVMDFDNLIGGYSNAKNNGLLFDDIHPNQKGHDLMAKELIKALIPNPLGQQYKISHSGNVGSYYDMILQLPSILGRMRVMSDILFGAVLKGYSDATAMESYLLMNKLKVVNDGTFDYVIIENYGANGSLVTMKDKTNPNVLQIRNANNLSSILSGKTLEIDTTDTDKFANFTRFRNLLVAEMGMKVGTPDQTKVGNNTLFVDASGVLKFKDNTGSIKTVSLS